jgi:hypothetical protein
VPDVVVHQHVTRADGFWQGAAVYIAQHRHLLRRDSGSSPQ